MSKKDQWKWLKDNVLEGVTLAPSPRDMIEASGKDRGYINNMYRDWVKDGLLVQPFGSGGPYIIKESIDMTQSQALEIQIQKYTYSTVPSMTFEPGGHLDGFEVADWPESARAKPLIEALGYTFDGDAEYWGLSEEEGFLVHGDGRLALTEIQTEGASFVVEVAT